KPDSPTNLSFLPLGHSSRSLASLIGCPRCTYVMESLRKLYRYVVVDCGRICASPDSLLLASLCDGVVSAVASAARRRNEFVGFQQAVQGLRVPLLGIVLTKGG